MNDPITLNSSSGKKIGTVILTRDLALLVGGLTRVAHLPTCMILYSILLYNIILYSMLTNN